MKKLLAICALMLAAALLFVNLAAVASAAPSPEASTYTTRSGRGGADETTTRGGRTTKPVPTSSGINGEDDPNSPNYTGNRAVTSDKTPVSPNTAAGQPYAAVAAGAVLLLTAAGALVLTKKKSTDEN